MGSLEFSFETSALEKTAKQLLLNNREHYLLTLTIGKRASNFTHSQDAPSQSVKGSQLNQKTYHKKYSLQTQLPENNIMCAQNCAKLLLRLLTPMETVQKPQQVPVCYYLYLLKQISKSENDVLLLSD